MSNVGTGGSIRILWDADDAAEVTITGNNLAAFTVGGSAVTFPYTLNSSTTFTTIHNGTYTVSVKHHGIEVAGTPDGTRTVVLENDTSSVFAPSPDNTSTAEFTSQLFGELSATFAPRGTRLIDRPYSATITQPGHRPLWLCNDRKTILGASQASPRLSYAYDDGVSDLSSSNAWVVVTQTAWFDGGILEVREMGNGELLVMTGPAPGTRNAAVWVSSGWATNKSTATFSVKLTSADANVNWGPWGIDVNGGQVILAEYGPKNGSTDMARYVWKSTDYGQTWTQIFDLVTQLGNVTNAHLHGVAYDPYWDAIWVTNGDGNINFRTWLSLDGGTTWKNVNAPQQFTSIHVLPDSVIFISDSPNPNAFYRIPRVDKNYPRFELVQMENSSATEITMIGQLAFRSKTTPGAPAVIGSNWGDQGGVSGPGKIYVTYDGVTYTKLWEDTGHAYQNNGVEHALGPTISGHVIADLQRAPDSADRYLVKLTPA